MTTGRDAAVPGLPERKTGARRRTEEGIEAVAAAVPFAGGVLSVKYAQAFRRADERRYAVWQQQVTEALEVLMKRVDGLSEDALMESDEFVDALATANRIAERSSAEEKRRALQNVLVNIGEGRAPDRDKRSIFLRYVDELTPSHMVLLDFMGDPVAYLDRAGLSWPNVYMGGLMSVIEMAFPEWAADEPLLDTLAGDLASRGLLDHPGFKTMMTADGLKAGRTKPKGREFLAFVTGPFNNGAHGAKPGD
jgi:hypothetical protein